MNFLLNFLIVFISPVLAFAVVEAVPHLTIRYNARPPFIYEEAGKVQGEVATFALKVIEESGVPYEVVHTPVNRQLMLIFAGQGFDCSMGWFRTPEREKNAKFTDATYDDGPWVAIGHKGTLDPQLKTAREILQNRKWRFLYQERFSNGPVLDQIIADLKPPSVLMEGDMEKMLLMVKSGRADYFFLSDIEFRHLLETTKSQRNEFVVIKVSDLPETPKRHIMCSKKVPDFVIERLNKAIQKVRSKS
ncbi:substrate-binding periplasmic protein [Bdellovibrio sp. HCB2-146]|uniref:substrate-binding periplasmic protein n=1 Tax=Bdellovibrio sp. HCB2-146 TaxID=3394362 RepID=UPI0039BCF79E